jgi:hypothetical protein
MWWPQARRRTQFNVGVSHLGPVARRREHVGALCREYAVTREYLPRRSERAHAFPEQRRVVIPQTTQVRSYYVALHEIGHCVVGFDRDLPVAPQEAATWQWAMREAIEPPTLGIKRKIFKALWHYLLSDVAVGQTKDLSNRDMFPSPDDWFWGFLASLDEPPRLVYEATKITARVGPPAAWQAAVNNELYEERRRWERELDRVRKSARRALIREQLRFYGPPSSARAGERALIGSGIKAHVWRQNGLYGAETTGNIFCGVDGVAHPAPAAAPTCGSCERLSSAEGAILAEAWSRRNAPL